jgi:hypothetical protein
MVNGKDIVGTLSIFYLDTKLQASKKRKLTGGS